MTITKLINELEKFKKKHGPRTQVTIDKKGMLNLSREDYTHTGIQSVQSSSILWAVEDDVCRKDGSERWKTVVVLNGE